jgi:hypothetical protein
MSTRNPFRIYRDRLRALRTKAYHVKNMRDPWEIAKYCHKELLETFDPKLRIQAEIGMIVELLFNRKEQNDFETPDFFRDQDFQFLLRKNGKSECIELRDVGLEEIPMIDRQKENNEIAVRKARAVWRAHCAVIEPLLKQHPDWRWGDACDWLEKHTGFPDIKV